MTSIPSGFARVATTAFVCACTPGSITKTAESDAFELRRASVIASAAAVPSSSIEAFESASAVMSQMTV